MMDMVGRADRLVNNQVHFESEAQRNSNAPRSPYTRKNMPHPRAVSADNYHPNISENKVFGREYSHVYAGQNQSQNQNNSGNYSPTKKTQHAHRPPTANQRSKRGQPPIHQTPFASNAKNVIDNINNLCDNKQMNERVAFDDSALKYNPRNYTQYTESEFPSLKRSASQQVYTSTQKYREPEEAEPQWYQNTPTVSGVQPPYQASQNENFVSLADQLQKQHSQRHKESVPMRVSRNSRKQVLQQRYPSFEPPVYVIDDEDLHEQNKKLYGSNYHIKTSNPPLRRSISTGGHPNSLLQDFIPGMQAVEASYEHKGYYQSSKTDLIVPVSPQRPQNPPQGLTNLNEPPDEQSGSDLDLPMAKTLGGPYDVDSHSVPDSSTVPNSQIPSRPGELYPQTGLMPPGSQATTHQANTGAPLNKNPSLNNNILRMTPQFFNVNGPIDQPSASGISGISSQNKSQNMASLGPSRKDVRSTGLGKGLTESYETNKPRISATSETKKNPSESIIDNIVGIQNEGGFYEEGYLSERTAPAKAENYNHLSPRNLQLQAKISESYTSQATTLPIRSEQGMQPSSTAPTESGGMSQQQLQAYYQKILELEGILREKEEELTGMRLEETKIRNENSGLKVEIERLQREVNALREEVERLKGSLTASRQPVVISNQDNSSVQGYVNEISHLKSKMIEKENNEALLKKNYEITQASVEALKQELLKVRSTQSNSYTTVKTDNNDINKIIEEYNRLKLLEHKYNQTLNSQNNQVLSGQTITHPIQVLSANVESKDQFDSQNLSKMRDMERQISQLKLSLSDYDRLKGIEQLYLNMKQNNPVQNPVQIQAQPQDPTQKPKLEIQLLPGPQRIIKGMPNDFAKNTINNQKMRDLELENLRLKRFEQELQAIKTKQKSKRPVTDDISRIVKGLENEVNRLKNVENELRRSGLENSRTFVITHPVPVQAIQNVETVQHIHNLQAGQTEGLVIPGGNQQVQDLEKEVARLREIEKEYTQLAMYEAENSKLRGMEPELERLKNVEKDFWVLRGELDSEKLHVENLKKDLNYAQNEVYDYQGKLARIKEMQAVKEITGNPDIKLAIESFQAQTKYALADITAVPMARPPTEPVTISKDGKENGYRTDKNVSARDSLQNSEIKFTVNQLYDTVKNDISSLSQRQKDLVAKIAVLVQKQKTESFTLKDQDGSERTVQIEVPRAEDIEDLLDIQKEMGEIVGRVNMLLDSGVGSQRPSLSPFKPEYIERGTEHEFMTTEPRKDNNSKEIMVETEFGFASMMAPARAKSIKNNEATIVDLNQEFKVIDILIRATKKASANFGSSFDNITDNVKALEKDNKKLAENYQLLLTKQKSLKNDYELEKKKNASLLQKKQPELSISSGLNALTLVPPKKKQQTPPATKQNSAGVSSKSIPRDSKDKYMQFDFIGERPSMTPASFNLVNITDPKEDPIAEEESSQENGGSSTPRLPQFPQDLASHILKKGREEQPLAMKPIEGQVEYVINNPGGNEVVGEKIIDDLASYLGSRMQGYNEEARDDQSLAKKSQTTAGLAELAILKKKANGLKTRDKRDGSISDKKSTSNKSRSISGRARSQTLASPQSSPKRAFQRQTTQKSPGKANEDAKIVDNLSFWPESTNKKPASQTRELKSNCPIHSAVSEVPIQAINSKDKHSEEYDYPDYQQEEPSDSNNYIEEENDDVDEEPEDVDEIDAQIKLRAQQIANLSRMQEDPQSRFNSQPVNSPTEPPGTHKKAAQQPALSMHPVEPLVDQKKREQMKSAANSIIAGIRFSKAKKPPRTPEHRQVEQIKDQVETQAQEICEMLVAIEPQEEYSSEELLKLVSKGLINRVKAGELQDKIMREEAQRQEAIQSQITVKAHKLTQMLMMIEPQEQNDTYDYLVGAAKALQKAAETTPIQRVQPYTQYIEEEQAQYFPPNEESEDSSQMPDVRVQEIAQIIGANLPPQEEQTQTHDILKGAVAALVKASKSPRSTSKSKSPKQTNREEALQSQMTVRTPTRQQENIFNLQEEPQNEDDHQSELLKEAVRTLLAQETKRSKSKSKSPQRKEIEREEEEAQIRMNIAIEGQIREKAEEISVMLNIDEPEREDKTHVILEKAAKFISKASKNSHMMTDTQIEEQERVKSYIKSHAEQITQMLKMTDPQTQDKDHIFLKKATQALVKASQATPMRRIDPYEEYRAEQEEELYVRAQELEQIIDNIPPPQAGQTQTHDILKGAVAALVKASKSPRSKSGPRQADEDAGRQELQEQMKIASQGIYKLLDKNEYQRMDPTAEEIDNQEATSVSKMSKGGRPKSKVKRRKSEIPEETLQLTKIIEMQVDERSKLENQVKQGQNEIEELTSLVKNLVEDIKKNDMESMAKKNKPTLNDNQIAKPSAHQNTPSPQGKEYSSVEKTKEFPIGPKKEAFDEVRIQTTPRGHPGSNDTSFDLINGQNSMKTRKAFDSMQPSHKESTEDLKKQALTATQKGSKFYPPKPNERQLQDSPARAVDNRRHDVSMAASMTSEESTISSYASLTNEELRNKIVTLKSQKTMLKKKYDQLNDRVNLKKSKMSMKINAMQELNRAFKDEISKLNSQC